MLEKPCRVCGIIKPLVQFKKSSTATDGVTNTCKPCANTAGREAVRAYKARNADAIRAQQRAAYHQDIHASREKQRQKYVDNRARRIASSAQYAKANTEKRRAWDRAWRAAHRDYNITKLAGKRALLRNLSELDRFALDEAAFLCALRQTMLGGKWEIDHIIPTSVGGTSQYTNIQVAPKSWNASKGNRHSQRFLG